MTRSTATLDSTAFICGELRRIAGTTRVFSDPLEVLTYECDALTHLRRRPVAVVLPSSAGSRCRTIVRLCARERRSVRAARAWHGAVGRSAAGRGRHRHRAVAAEPGPGRRHPESPGHGRARRDQPRDHPAGRALRLLLRARSVESAGLLDRRQRRRELRRRALPEVRVHRAPRARRRGGAARRASWCSSAASSPITPGPICSAC